MTTAAETNRLAVVSVMGSGRLDGGWRAELTGHTIARLGTHLITGGGQGTMATVCRAFVSNEGRKGKSIGILPGDEDGNPPPGYPNPWIDLVIQTHLPLSGSRGTEPMSRNHINILSADAIVVLDGGAGTHSEAQLALRYKKPFAVFAERRAFPELPDDITWIEDESGLKGFLNMALRLQIGH